MAGNNADAYKRLIRGRIGTDSALADLPGPGAALNNQSIVIKVSAGGWSALLAGDMQFAKPEVAGVGEFMTALRGTVAENGPYDFIKLTHHTSYNGLDESVLGEWSDTKLFAHSGGSNDTDHPEQGALTLLESHKDQLTFARTDRNGIISITKNGSVKMRGAEGELNDFSPNRGTDVIEPAEAEPPVKVKPGRGTVAIVRRADGESVEVTAKVPHTATTVTITIQIDPGEKKTGRPMNWTNETGEGN